AQELGSEGNDVAVTQVVPHYEDALPVTADFRKQVHGDDVNFVSLEGYIAARAFVEVLRAAGPAATRETFIDTVESGKAFDLGMGKPLAMSPQKHQLSDMVWPTFLRDGRFRPLRRWSDLGSVT